MTTTSAFDAQKRRRSIAMTEAEVNDYLQDQRICRLATVNKYDRPHVTALWFVWDGEWMWINSVTKSQRYADFSARPKVSALVDSGHSYAELRGVELVGEMEIVADDVDTSAAGQLFSAKYADGQPFVQDQYHAWVRLKPTKVLSWDHSKLPTEKQKK